MQIKKQENQKSWGSQRQWMFIMAAALAATGDYTGETLTQRGEKMELPATFEEGAALTEGGRLRTENDYQVRLDKVEIDPRQLAMIVSGAEGAEQIEGADVELGELIKPDFLEMDQMAHGGGDLSITLTGAQLEGRVFDSSGRLPQEGVKISGTLPVEVRIRSEKRLDLWNPGVSETVMAVDFEVPSDYFEEVDWRLLVASEA